MDIRQFVRSEEDIWRVKDILGYHGTSIEAVDLLVSERKFPASGIRPEYFCAVSIVYGTSDAIWYAHQIAARHFIAKELPFKLPSHQHALAAQALVDPKLMAFRHGAYQKYFDELKELAQSKGMTEGDIIRIVKRGYDERKGCLLTLSTRMLKDIPTTHIEAEIEFIVPKEGISIDYVTGICPLGEYEQRRLNQLTHELL